MLNPSEVQRELFHKMAMRTQRERQQQAEEERQRMAEWIAAYHRITHQLAMRPAKRGFHFSSVSGKIGAILSGSD